MHRFRTWNLNTRVSLFCISWYSKTVPMSNRDQNNVKHENMQNFLPHHRRVGNHEERNQISWMKTKAYLLGRKYNLIVFESLVQVFNLLNGF